MAKSKLASRGVTTPSATLPQQLCHLTCGNWTAGNWKLSSSDNLQDNQCADPARAIADRIMNRMAFLGSLCDDSGWEKPTLCCSVSERRSSLCD
jgi:hypothetical protein